MEITADIGQLMDDCTYMVERFYERSKLVLGNSPVGGKPTNDQVLKLTELMVGSHNNIILAVKLQEIGKALEHLETLADALERD